MLGNERKEKMAAVSRNENIYSKLDDNRNCLHKPCVERRKGLDAKDVFINQATITSFVGDGKLIKKSILKIQ